MSPAPKTSPAEAARNCEVLRELLEKHGLTKQQAADLIHKHTIRPCSLRAIEAWLSTAPSARPCPGWAVVALKAALTKRNKS